MTGDNLIETVVAEKVTEFGPVRLVRSEFDVDFQIGGGPWQTERQTAWQVLGVGHHSLGTTEAEARRRFNRK